MPHKISCPYIERYHFYTMLKIQELLVYLRVHRYFIKHAPEKSTILSCTYCKFQYCVTKVRKLRGTIVNIILPQRVSFYRCEFYFTAARFILLPRVLFYCRKFYFTAASLFYCPEFCFTAASFILLPRVLFYCREFYFLHREFYFTAPRFNVKNKSRGGKIILAVVKIKVAVVKIKLAAVKQNSRR